MNNLLQLSRLTSFSKKASAQQHYQSPLKLNAPMEPQATNRRGVPHSHMRQ